MKLNKLPKTTAKSKKRVGRGYGGGKGGHTTGRGMKGQKARSKVGLLFEGTKTKKSYVKKTPMLRGKGKLTPLRKKPTIVNLESLEKLPAGAKVTAEALVKAGLVKKAKIRKYGVKILGKGELKKKLTVLLPVSAKAKEKIEKAGGKHDGHIPAINASV